MTCNTQSRLVPLLSLDHAQSGEETEGNCKKDSPIAGQSGGGGGDWRRGCLTGVGEEGEPGAVPVLVAWLIVERYGGGRDGARRRRQLRQHAA